MEKSVNRLLFYSQLLSLSSTPLQLFYQQHPIIIMKFSEFVTILSSAASAAAHAATTGIILDGVKCVVLD